ncbi:MAG: hypothetical protein LM573_06910 [Thermofilum sp.]|nr:hypothetical protein [Thermofilum sp.]
MKRGLLYAGTPGKHGPIAGESPIERPLRNGKKESGWTKKEGSPEGRYSMIGAR